MADVGSRMLKIRRRPRAGARRFPGAMKPAAVALCACAAIWSAPLWGGDSQVVVNAGTARMQLPVVSLRAQRDAGVVKQRHDYSCGSAALATLLSYGLDDAVDEEALLRSLIDPLSAEELAALQDKGLSLRALQQLARERGHKAQGFRVGASQLAKLTRPVIVFVKPGGYGHFAVLKGLRGDRAYLADPSIGNLRMPLYRFLDMWADEAGQGVILVVERASGEWPARYALQLGEPAGPPLEVLGAARRIDAATPLPTLIPDR